MQTGASPQKDSQAAAGSMEVSPQMQQPLDVPVPDLADSVHDLKLTTREFPDGTGKFSALHNTMMSRSLLTGCVESKASTGGMTKYEGTFLNDPHNERPVPHGQGQQTNADGSTLAGQWKDGLLDGNGEWRAAGSCESYVGEWKKGKKHGFGVYKYANGDLYEGDWANGLYQDRGKYVYANGDEFLGFFEAGNKKHGTFYFRDGRVSRRVWGEHGRLVSCQEYDARKRTYQPTMTSSQIHDPALKPPALVGGVRQM
mmetsp:Transcript_31364/g.57560  ORF Transcript_31364/g.57560 Transcript_31364/m.57560 type:complete len:256 (-) Transcript_31364:85-852(-)